MLDLFLTLEGIWDLQDDVSVVETSHSDFYGDLYASHFTKEENCVLTITASNLNNDSISYTYSSKRISTTREFLVDKFNLFFPSGSSSSSGSSTSSSSSSCNSTIFGSVISLDVSSGSCSLLVIGPLPGQRVIEKYTLETGSSGQGEGMQLCVRYFISSIEGDFQVARKYNRRMTVTTSRKASSLPSSPSHTSSLTSDSKDWASDMPALLQFPSNHSVNNWKRVKSHSFATLQALHIEISVENNLQSLVAPDSTGTCPDSSYPSANAVIMYRIQVYLPAKDNHPLRSWHVLYRYSHFRSLWTQLSIELADIRDSTAKQLPDWPFVKSESSLQYRCKGLQHFICGVTSQGGYEPSVGSRAANMVDLLSGFLEVPNHFMGTTDTDSSAGTSPTTGSGGVSRDSINSLHYCQSVFQQTPSTTSTSSATSSASASAQEQSLPLGISSPDRARRNSERDRDMDMDRQRSTAAPVFVVVKGARNRRAPMFPHVSLFEWVPIVEYELFITRVEDNASKSVFRRYKDISCWFQNILDILSVSQSGDVLKSLNLPAKKSTRHVNTFSSSSKTDVTGNFVKFRIGELQKSIQSLLTEFPVVVSLPLSQEFFELHKFPSPGTTENVKEEDD